MDPFDDSFDSPNIESEVLFALSWLARELLSADARGSEQARRYLGARLLDERCSLETRDRALDVAEALLCAAERDAEASSRALSETLSFIGKIVLTASLVGLAFLLAHEGAPLYSYLTAISALCVWNVKEPFFRFANAFKTNAV